MPNSVWLHYDQKALDDQYNQRILVPNANEYMARHGVLSAQVRAELECRLDVPYGPTEDEKVDIFPAAQKGAPLVVYFHGGAWTRWHKDNNSFQAPHFVKAGATFVPVNFALVPQVPLEELVRQCRASVAWAYEHAAEFGADPDKLYVAGHSSGAHVVGLLAANDWATEFGLPADVIKGAYAASGMYDLEPVRLCSRQEYLNLVERLGEGTAPARPSGCRRTGPARVASFRSRRTVRQSGRSAIAGDLPGYGAELDFRNRKRNHESRNMRNRQDGRGDGRTIGRGRA